jgi:hypothetical protein
LEAHIDLFKCDLRGILLSAMRTGAYAAVRACVWVAQRDQRSIQTAQQGTLCGSPARQVRRTKCRQRLGDVRLSMRHPREREVILVASVIKSCSLATKVADEHDSIDLT